MLEKKVPKINLDFVHSERRGRLIKMRQYVCNRNQQKFNSFITKAWNELPKRIRDQSNVTVDTFKQHLDKYLMLLEDNPHVQNEKYRRCGNDLISVMRYFKEENRRYLGRAPLSTMH